jgi:RNA polymerase sigma-70 factor, ECF subfamily
MTVNSDETDKTFQELYNKYYNRIFNYIYRQVLNKEIAEDISAEVFLKAFRNIKINNPLINNFNAWIYKIATNEIYTYIKKNKKYINYTLFNEEKIEHQDSINTQYEIDFTKFIDFIAVNQVIKKLKPKERLLVDLYFFQHKKYHEISKILEIKENTLRPMISGIIKKIKKNLK